MKLRRSILRSAATDLPEAGGPALHVVPLAEATPAPAASESPAKPSLLQLAHAAVTSKAGLIAELAAARESVSALTTDLDYARAELATMATEHSALQLDLAGLRAEREELAAALTKAVAEATTAEAGAVAFVATLGVAADTLPETAIPGESREELLAALAAEKDPVKRWDLAERINAL